MGSSLATKHVFLLLSLFGLLDNLVLFRITPVLMQFHGQSVWMDLVVFVGDGATYSVTSIIETENIASLT